MTIQEIFHSQQTNQFLIGNTTAKERIEKLNQLKKAVEITYRKDIQIALHNDFRKHPSEVDLTEIYPVISEIKHAKKHIRSWMRNQHVRTPLALLGSSSWIKYEPKGVCLIISPWNFPFNLTLAPLASAIAAGNTIIIKPSELTPHSADLMKKIIENNFSSNEVAVILGDASTSTELLQLPFNHIFYTGSSSVGKIVMEAAAKNLASVTLELGGKSPTIVDATANLHSAATRIAWGKFMNNGQLCIAPDYLFVHKDIKEKFIDLVQKKIEHFYSPDPSKESSYNRIVNGKHFDRLKNSLDDAISKGAKITLGGTQSKQDNYIAPTIIENAPMDSTLMTDEIFGPILPMYSYSNIDEVIAIINSKEKPLAMYIYSTNHRNINNIIARTRAGGTCINNNAVHFFNNNLPFGGSNNSGIGKSHGFYGFQAFSNARSMYKQNIPGALELLMPPYNRFKQFMIDLTIKWF